MENNNEKKLKRILIVDDDELVRGVYVDVFKSAGFEVFESQDGLDGLQNAIANKPDIIFTGIIMPRMDGFTLMQELKKNTATANIPVTISSHLGREEDRKEAERLGAKDFFVKDSDSPREVVARVKSIFEKSIYRLKFNPEALDAKKLAQNMQKEGTFSCPVCGDEIIMSIKMLSLEKGEFTGKFICPKCDN